MTATAAMMQTLSAAMQAKADPVPARMYLSCARVYVTVFGPKKRIVKAAAAKLGLKWTHRGLYVGYDNATGHEYMRGEAIARALTAAGVSCYQHTDQD